MRYQRYIFVNGPSGTRAQKRISKKKWTKLKRDSLFLPFWGRLSQLECSMVRSEGRYTFARIKILPLKIFPPKADPPLAEKREMFAIRWETKKRFWSGFGRLPGSM